MKLVLNVAVALVVALFAGVACADGMNIKPGKWEFRSQSSLPGAGGTQKHTNTQCITEEQLKPETMMQDMQQGCELLESKVDGDTMTWKVHCNNPGGEMTGVGHVSGSNETISGGMEMTMSFSGQQMNMNMSWDGSYVGACE